MNRRLGSLGAREVVKRGEGDERDRKGIEDGFEKWLKDLLSTLLELYPLPEDMTVIPPDMIYPPRIALTPTNPPTNPEPLPIDIDPEYCTATLVGNKRITALDWTQDVRNFEFEFDDDLSYVPYLPMDSLLTLSLAMHRETRFSSTPPHPQRRFKRCLISLTGQTPIQLFLSPTPNLVRPPPFPADSR